MASFVYLAVGAVRDIQVFKIGKTNSLKQRTAALRMQLTSHIACIDEIEALELEALLIVKAQSAGAHNLLPRKEYFRYSETVYQKVFSWFDNDRDELIAQVATKAQAKRDRIAKKAATFNTVMGSATAQRRNSNDAFRYKSASPNPITLEEMQAVIDSKLVQIAQLEHTTNILSKRRDSYLLTIQVLQEEVIKLRRELVDVELRVREEVYKEQEKYIAQLHGKHEQEIKALLKQIDDLQN